MNVVNPNELEKIDRGVSHQWIVINDGNDTANHLVPSIRTPVWRSSDI
jgi:hypothetical protein